jgi:hypothetical protein
MTLPNVTPIGQQLTELFGSAQVLISSINDATRNIQAKAKSDGKAVNIELVITIGHATMHKASVSPTDSRGKPYVYVSGIDSEGEAVFMLAHFSSVNVQFKQHPSDE